MKTLRIILIALTATMAVLAADINGTWEGDMYNRNGDIIHVDMNLKAENGVLTGTVRTPAGEAEIRHGEVEGEYILFNVVRDVNGHQITQKYRGHVNAETIDFTVTTLSASGEQPQDFVMKKIGG